MRFHFLIFILLFGLVIISHYLLDSKYLDYGMHSDDWISLVRYKALEADLLDKIQIFWKRPGLGPHVTSQIIYMGFLEGIFGLNYQAFASINIAFKILATISLYPLVFLVFKRRLLAFLAVIFYSISYSTVGTLRNVVKGTEYQAIIFMNIFLTIYYLVSIKQTLSLGWLITLILSFSIALLLAPNRLFPLALLPLIIEFLLWIHNRTYNLKFGVKKLFFLYLPFILLFIYHPVAITGRFIIPAEHLKKIIEGYWYTPLNPVSGLGYTILWDSYWVKLIGSLKVDSFNNYLIYILSQITVAFGVISTILALFISKNIKRFILLTICPIFTIGILVFFLATNHLKIPIENRVNFDFNTLYSVFVGIFVIIFSINSYIEWLSTGKKNRLLLAIWTGSLTSFYFIFCNWLFARPFLSFTTSQEYLTIPAIGVSLMLAVLLTIFYDKIKTIKVLNLGKVLAVYILLLAFIPIYSINKARTTDSLSSMVRQNNALKQQDIQQKIRVQIKESATNKNVLVFFDWTKDQLNSDFYSEAIHSSFPQWMHYYDGRIIEGCINEITNKKTLANSITEKNGKKGFLWQGVCVETPSGNFFLNQEVFYELKDFYAFEINNNKLVDIREIVLKEIGIKEAY